MSLEKTERNELIAKLYSQGKTNQEILAGLQEVGHLDLSGVASVKMQVSKLRKVGRLPKERPVGKQVDSVTSQQITKSLSHQVYKRMTFYLKPETIKDIKRLALERDLNISNLVRGIIENYLSQQRDL